MYDPSMRVLTVLELLQAHEEVSGADLARRLEVSPRTVQRYVALATPQDQPQMTQQLTATAARTLALFAGAESAVAGQPGRGGLQGLADFLEQNVPEADRARISEVLLRILNGTLYELANLTREQAGQPPLRPDERTQAFMTQAVVSLSDSFVYPAPLLLQLGLDHAHQVGHADRREGAAGVAEGIVGFRRRQRRWGAERDGGHVSGLPGLVVVDVVS